MRTVLVIDDEGATLTMFKLFHHQEEGREMGLGLSITNGIVVDYGGLIEVISKEGKGTEFILSFPEAAGQAGNS